MLNLTKLESINDNSSLHSQLKKFKYESAKRLKKYTILSIITSLLLVFVIIFMAKYCIKPGMLGAMLILGVGFIASVIAFIALIFCILATSIHEYRKGTIDKVSRLIEDEEKNHIDQLHEIYFNPKDQTLKCAYELINEQSSKNKVIKQGYNIYSLAYSHIVDFDHYSPSRNYIENSDKPSIEYNVLKLDIDNSKFKKLSNYVFKTKEEENIIREAAQAYQQRRWLSQEQLSQLLIRLNLVAKELYKNKAKQGLTIEEHLNEVNTIVKKSLNSNDN